MANSNAPFGFSQRNGLGSSPTFENFELPNGGIDYNTAAIYAGDPVVRQGSGDGTIKQALFNVMKNALEAMDRGGDIHVSLTSDDEWIILSIRDTGVGIPADKMTRVFDAYYTTKASGGGIGMLILLRIMRAHGGTVDIQSTPDVGTNVILRFPLKHRRVRTLEAPKS